MLKLITPYIIPTAFFVFWSITFLESALSKIFDIHGNLEYFKSQFSKSILANLVVPSFYWILTLELVCGVMSLVSIFFLYFELTTFFAVGVITSALIAFTLISLFAGQRIAKDYGGASGIVGYILVSLFGIMAMFGR